MNVRTHWAQSTPSCALGPSAKSGKIHEYTLCYWHSFRTYPYATKKLLNPWHSVVAFSNPLAGAESGNSWIHSPRAVNPLVAILVLLQKRETLPHCPVNFNSFPRSVHSETAGGREGMWHHVPNPAPRQNCFVNFHKSKVANLEISDSCDSLIMRYGQLEPDLEL